MSESIARRYPPVEEILRGKARTADEPFPAAAVRILAARVESFRKRARKAAARHDAGNIHDLRVASRRLREGLALFERLFPPDAYRKHYRSVRRIARRLGDVRNADVARDLCAVLLRETPNPACALALGWLAKRYERDRKAATEHLEETLRPRKIREEGEALATFVRAARIPVENGAGFGPQLPYNVLKSRQAVGRGDHLILSATNTDAAVIAPVTYILELEPI